MRISTLLTLIATIVGSAESRSYAAVGCGSFCGELTAHYLDHDCAIEVEALVNPFNDCGAALPGQLKICLYKNAPSSLGGVLIGCVGTGCELRDGSEDWRVTFSPWPSPGTTQFFVEAFVDPGDSNTDIRCANVDPVRLPAIPPGDSDGDGVDTCADNCPNAQNSLQVDVDSDGRGDACDPTRGDFNGDGHVDRADFELLLTCLGGDGVLSPPPGCSEAEFEKADLDGDFDVDFADLRAFQVFFGQ